MKRFFFIACWSLVLCEVPGRAQTIFSENFESVVNNALPAGWQGAPATGGIWKTGVNNDFVTGGLSFPQAHSKFLGLQLDTTWEGAGRTDILTLPLIPLQNTQTYNNLTLYMSLYYIPVSGDICAVDISYDTGQVWSNIYYSLPTKIWDPCFVYLPQIINKSSIMLRFKHTATANGSMAGLFMDDLKLYVQASVDAAIYDVLPHNDTLHNYAGLAQGDTITASVLNMTAQPIADLVLKYKLGNGPVYAQTFTAINLQPFSLVSLKHLTPCTVPTVADYPLKVWVEATGDGDHTNDTGKTTILGAAFLPDKKPLVEERGGTWCGWCVRGLFYNDSLWRAHPNEASIISVHNSHGAPDPMTIPAYDAFLNDIVINGQTPAIYGYPSIITDRKEIEDPLNTLNMYDLYKPYFGYGNLDISNVSLSGNDVSLIVNFKAAVNLNGNYRLGLVITEDSVHNANGGFPWSQTNSYSYMLQNIPFFGYEALPSPIPAAQMYYDFVARTNLDKPSGVAGSLPTVMTYNSTYSYTFHTTLDTGWKLDQLRAVAILYRANDSVVLNTNNKMLLSAVGVNNIAVNTQMEVFPNPANEVVYVQCSFEKETAVDLKLTDMLGRVVYQQNYFSKPQQSFSVPVKGIPTGPYNLQLKTKEGTLNKMVSITDR